MRFTLPFVAQPEDIDELGHVNNAVWVRWVQHLSVSHWQAVAPAEQQAALVWVVTRHEIDYRGNLGPGERAIGETWIASAPKGARFDRHWRFLGDDGKVRVEGVSTWALVDRATGRLLRVRPEIAAPFLSGGVPDHL
jgi:acyl-CoA thioester hydrolase